MGNEQDSKRFRDFAVAFFEEAREDLDAAKDLFEKERYARAVFLSQQAVEKAVKSLLEMEKVFIAEHDIINFFVKFICNNERYNNFKKSTDSIRENLNFFNRKWSKTRYPTEEKGIVIKPKEYYKENDALMAMEKAEETLAAIKEILIKKWDIKL